ncbi:MAG: DUF3499 family protein [Actinobacteria bacterium]|nr:DUF3499 family protein [Actinomycetota bacterium]
MRRCGRPGCNEPATATFTFSSRHQSVWLDHLGQTNASAGHLCQRHADALAPPRGWELHDRRDLARVIEHAAEPEPEIDESRTPLLARAFRGARRAS